MKKQPNKKIINDKNNSNKKSIKDNIELNKIKTNKEKKKFFLRNFYENINKKIVKLVENIESFLSKQIDKGESKINATSDQLQKGLKRNTGKYPLLRLMRADKPHAYLLLMMPIWWSIMLGARDLIQAIAYILFFSFGAIITRSAGCIINDIIDRKTDANVARTKNRPLASGEIQLKRAFIALFVLLSIAALMLLFLPIAAVKIACLALIGMIVYPLMKYVMDFPQLILGIVFNLGVLIAWYTVQDRISLVPLLIYFGSLVWTTAYDTIYGFQDYNDDKKIGIKSLSIRLNKENVKPFIWNMFKIVVLCLWLAGYISQLNWLFTVTVLAALYSLYYQVTYLDILDPKSCEKRFKMNILFGIVITIGIILGKF